MNEHVRVRIEKLVYGGNGIARLENGKAVFVRETLPGELVLARITGRRKGVFEAVPLEVLEPSPDRVDPPCRGETQCTGATWPHISYPAQLRLKEEILLEALHRGGQLSPRRPLSILPSPLTDHYRLRTQFTMQTVAGTRRIGFFRPGSSTIIEVEDAFLLHPLINRALAGIRANLGLLPPLEEIHVNATPAGEVHLMLFARGDTLPSQDDFFERLTAAVPTVIGISGYAGRRKAFSLGRNILTLDVEGLTLHATEGNFYQVNWEQNRNMVRTVLDFADLNGGETVLDLYCGIGNFALPLARKAGRVIGIDSGYAAVEDARWNAQRNGLANTEFRADDLERGLRPLKEQKLRSDVIVLDPPRSGATRKTLERILAFVPRKIIYVSCNPSTLARDLTFFRLFGFRLDRLRPVDMFPWTWHIEAVAEMVRE